MPCKSSKYISLETNSEIETREFHLFYEMENKSESEQKANKQSSEPVEKGNIEALSKFQYGG